MNENITNETESMRLNRFLAQAGVASRRDADKLIESGRVTVNGIVASMGVRVSKQDVVMVDGKVVKADEEYLVYAYYKPKGVTCSSRDEHAERLITDEVNLPASYTYAGRLDRDSEGLILLTNDGQLIQNMMRAASYHEKEYEVKVDKDITDAFLQKMKAGIFLEELQVTTRPCKIKMLGVRSFRIILTQGINRQIRRMCETCGYRVLSLKRIRVLNVKLADMKVGELRLLSEEESKELYDTVQKGRKAAYPSHVR